MKVGPSVLVVEDDENIRELYASALASAELTVFKAVDGKEGVKLALKHHPNVILMDIEMPVMNGHEAVHKIRKDTWGKTARIVYLTNHSDAENVVNAVAEGSQEYIVKANTEVKEVVNLVRTIMYM